MKTAFLRAFACAAAVAVAGMWSGAAQAQDIQLASHADMNNIYARLAEVESRLAATNVATSGGECGGDFADACASECCDRSGFIAGGEVLFLRPYESEGDLNDFDYEEGYRFWIGWQASGGLGVRLRYFDYEDEVAATGDLFDVSAVDLEIYDAVQLGSNWDLNIGGGIRYLDLHTDEAASGFDEITGVGPVLSAELVRHISHRAAVYAIARESIIVGDGFDGGVAEPDLTVAVSEIQLGLQGQRDWRGGLLFARLGWEAQFYHDIMDGENGAALMGAVFGAGIMR